MNNDDLLYIVQDPDLTTVHAARALIELAESVSGRDDDIAKAGRLFCRRRILSHGHGRPDASQGGAGQQNGCGASHV